MNKTAPAGARPFTPAIATLAFIGILEFIAIHQIRPPDVVPANAPPAEFSSARALQHLKLIAERPRPTGSAENARVRAYIIDQLKALGLTVTAEVVAVAVQAVFPGGIEGVDQGEVVRKVFLHQQGRR